MQALSLQETTLKYPKGIVRAMKHIWKTLGNLLKTGIKYRVLKEFGVSSLGPP